MHAEEVGDHDGREAGDRFDYGAFGLPKMNPGDEPARPGLRGVLDGLAFLARTPVIRGALLTDLATTVLSMPISLFPLINTERFGGNPRTLGLFLTAIAVGGVAASLFSGTFTRFPRAGLAMLGGSATWGAALTLFGFSPNPWAGLTFLVIAGAADTVSVVSRNTVVQMHTRTNYSAASALPNRSSGKRDLTSATCAAASSQTPPREQQPSSAVACYASEPSLWWAPPRQTCAVPPHCPIHIQPQPAHESRSEARSH